MLSSWCVVKAVRMTLRLGSIALWESPKQERVSRRQLQQCTVKASMSARRLIHFCVGRMVCNSQQAQPDVPSEYSLQGHQEQKVVEVEAADLETSQPHERRVPLSEKTLERNMKARPDMLENTRFLKVAVLGVPNVGKSTLINSLMNWRVCAVSKKVHTTCNSSCVVHVEGNTQIVFLDTPGIITATESARYKLESTHLTHPERSLAEADLIVVVHDVTRKWKRNELLPQILRLLYLYPEKKSVLVLNKVDCLKKKQRYQLLTLTKDLTEGSVHGQEVASVSNRRQKKLTKQQLFEKMKAKEGKTDECDTRDSQKGVKESLPTRKPTEKELQEMITGKKGWSKFDEVFMLSALLGDGVDQLQAYLVAAAKPAPWLYSSSVVTTQTPRQIVLQAVKEKLLEYLPEEVPYHLKPEIEYWEEKEDAGFLHVVVQVKCYRPHTHILVIRKVQLLVQEAEQELRNTFQCDVKLRLSIIPYSKPR